MAAPAQSPSLQATYQSIPSTHLESNKISHNENTTAAPQSAASQNPNTSTHNIKSFASIVAQPQPANIQNISLLPSSIHKGLPSLKLSKEAIDAFARPFVWTLVGKFPYGRPTMEAARIAFTTFHLKGVYKLGHLDYRHMLIQLNNEEDFQRLWTREVWHVDGFTMRTAVWTPSWKPQTDSSIVPVWVSLPGLPVHLFNKVFLFSLARIFGKPMSIDKATAELSRPSVAKVLVQVDLRKKLPEKIHVDCGDCMPSFIQTVEYDNMPRYCSHCSLLGHDEFNCRVLNAELKKNNEVVGPKKPEKGKNVTEDKISNINKGETKKMYVPKMTVRDQKLPKAVNVVNPVFDVDNQESEHNDDLEAEKIDEEIILENPNGTMHSQSTPIEDVEATVEIGTGETETVIENDKMVTVTDDVEVPTVEENGNNDELFVDDEARIRANVAAYKANHPQASSAPNLRPSSSRTPNPKYFNSEYINPKNLKEALTLREKCDSEPDGGLSDTSPSAFDDARIYGGMIGGVQVDPVAPMASCDNLEDYYDEDDGFQKVKGKRRKAGSKATSKPKRSWNPRRHPF